MYFLFKSTICSLNYSSCLDFNSSKKMRLTFGHFYYCLTSLCFWRCLIIACLESCREPSPVQIGQEATRRYQVHLCITSLERPSCFPSFHSFSRCFPWLDLLSSSSFLSIEAFSQKGRWKG